MQLSIAKGDLSKTAADALVNAADTSLKMGGGVAAALRKQGGKDVEEEALELAPIEVGQVIATTAGKLNAKFVLHVAVIVKPGSPATTETVAKGLRSALELADSLDCQTIALPAIGCGAGGLALPDGANAILSTLKSFAPQNLRHAFVVLHSDDALSAFDSVSSQLGVPSVKYVAPVAAPSADSDDDSKDPSEGTDA